MAFNWRLVLENPDLPWPPETIAQARDMRDAESVRRQARPQPLVGVRHLCTGLIRLLRAAEVDRFFDNRDPRDWTDPIQIAATEWVS